MKLQDLGLNTWDKTKGEKMLNETTYIKHVYCLVQNKLLISVIIIT